MPNITRVSAQCTCAITTNRLIKPKLGGGVIEIVSYFVFWTPGSTNNNRSRNVSSRNFSYRIFNLQTTYTLLAKRSCTKSGFPKLFVHRYPLAI